MGRFTNFHNHDGYSFLDGASKPKDIVARCKELGFKYVCQSNHGNVAGHLEMYDEARAAGLIPVLGTELYCRDPIYDNGKKKGFHLCIWAKNEEGLHNVWAISSNTFYATGDGHRIPNAEWEHFDGLGSGVICTSACMASALSYAAKQDNEEIALYFARKFDEIFDDFYIEIHTNSMPEQREVNLWLLKFAREHGFKVVPAVDAHYALKEDADFHDLWLGCQTKSFYTDQHWTMDHEYYIQSEDEVRERLAYLGEDGVQECLDGLDDLLSKIEDIEIDSSHKVPTYPLPDGWSDSGEYLKHLSILGLLTKVAGVEIIESAPGHIKYKGKITKNIEPYIQQLTEEELPIIIDNGLADYFLITSDYCRWAKERMLVGPGRGSACASVLCYLIGITEIDPIGKGLVFSRFLNEGRLNSIPDVDLDFEDQLKPMVHEYLVDKYGEDRVTAVGVITYFGMKLAIKEVCRYYKIPMSDSNRLTSIVGDLEDMAGKGESWREKIDLLKSDDRDFLAKYETEYPDLFSRAERMVGLPRQGGKHAAGYVVSPVSLAKILPIRKSNNDEIISQFDKVAVERLGFLKADILGLRNLTTLRLAAELVKERTGETIDYYKLKDSRNDVELWSQFEYGHTRSFFQMEGSGITDVCMRLKPRSISDLSTIVALYRPGVIGAGMLDKYIARATGQEEVEYLTPLLEPILENTYGIIVYQEQAMRIFSDLADFTPTEADHIRAAIGKKKMDKILAEKPKFIAGCEKNGVSKEISEEIFRQIEASGNYSFNLAHSLAYATIAYWTAYMKAHHFLEWYCACMSTVSMDKAPMYIREARGRGINIMPPVLSKMGRDYTIVSDTEITYGLEGIKGVGSKAVDCILNNAPYISFEDFVDRSGVNSAVIKTLIRAGLFREIYPNSRDLLVRYESGDLRSTLFGDSLSEETRSDYEHEPYTEERIAEIETELFGMPLSVDPFDKYRKQVELLGVKITSVDVMSAAQYGTAHVFLAKIASVKTHMSKSGMMAFVSFETDNGEILEATCFADMYKAARDILIDGMHVIVEILKKEYRGKTSLQVNKLKKLGV